jgi:hypothetical protein
MEVDGIPPQTYEIVSFDQFGHYERYAMAKAEKLFSM